jgi:hypothetical protein
VFIVSAVAAASSLHTRTAATLSLCGQPLARVAHPRQQGAQVQWLVLRQMHQQAADCALAPPCPFLLRSSWAVSLCALSALSAASPSVC